MNKKMMCGLALLCAFGASASAATRKAAGMSKTLTGCLQKGTEAGTFMLTNVTGGPAATNKDWELIEVPAALKMVDHVGHKVAVTGSVVGVGATMKTEQKTSTTTTASDAKVETKTKEVMAEEHTQRHLRVKSMKHIAATCP